MNQWDIPQFTITVDKPTFLKEFVSPTRLRQGGQEFEAILVGFQFLAEEFTKRSSTGHVLIT